MADYNDNDVNKNCDEENEKDVDDDCSSESDTSEDEGQKEKEDDIVDLYEEDVKPGLTFESKEIAMKSLKFFFADHYHPCVVVSNGTNRKKGEPGARGRVRFVCSHGYRRKYTASSSRPVQRVNFTGCQCGLNINEQNNGTWKVGLKVTLDHIGHEIGPELFSSYSFAKKLSEDDIEFVIVLAKSKAPVRKIAEVLSSRTGDHYKSKDVRNLLTKHKSKLSSGTLIEKDLERIIEDGGEVRIEKDKDSGYASVMWIQTSDMKKSLARIKPTVFEADTTFSTNSEGRVLARPF